jgi:acetyl-CoA synthetase
MSYYKVVRDNILNITINQFIEPRKFWGKIAEENFTWYQQWDKVVGVPI